MSCLSYFTTKLPWGKNPGGGNKLPRNAFEIPKYKYKYLLHFKLVPVCLSVIPDTTMSSVSHLCSLQLTKLTKGVSPHVIVQPCWLNQTQNTEHNFGQDALQEAGGGKARGSCSRTAPRCLLGREAGRLDWHTEDTQTDRQVGGRQVGRVGRRAGNLITFIGVWNFWYT